MKVTVIPEINPNRPPDPPSWLRDGAADEWRNLWTAGVATLWTSADADQVARLASLRAAFARSTTADQRARLQVQILRIEESLMVSPTVRRRLGIVTERVITRPDDNPIAERRAELEARVAQFGRHPAVPQRS